MKWTKFKDTQDLSKIPSYSFVTNFEDVWIRDEYDIDTQGWDVYGKFYPEEAWAEIEIPEVPKKEVHRCEKGGHQCFEIDSCLALDIKGVMPIVVKFCPFCGYSIKEKHAN